jgi:hypothetical protein
MTRLAEPTLARENIAQPSAFQKKTPALGYYANPTVPEQVRRIFNKSQPFIRNDFNNHSSEQC